MIRRPAGARALQRVFVVAVFVLAITRLTCHAQTPGCQVATVLNPTFSGRYRIEGIVSKIVSLHGLHDSGELACVAAAQVASLVQELRQALSAGCYSIMAASFGVCLPDLALLQGCCSTTCSGVISLVSWWSVFLFFLADLHQDQPLASILAASMQPCHGQECTC
jgi:hypothetical protein